MSCNLSFGQVIEMSLDDYIAKSGMYVSPKLKNPRVGNQDKGSVSQRCPDTNSYDKNCIGEPIHENNPQQLSPSLNSLERNKADNGCEINKQLRYAGRNDLDKPAAMENVRQWSQTQQKSLGIFYRGRRNKKKQNQQYFQQNRYRNNKSQNQQRNCAPIPNINQNFRNNGYNRKQNEPWSNMNTNRNYFNRNENASIPFPMNNLRSSLNINPFETILSEMNTRKNCIPNLMEKAHHNPNLSHNNVISAGSIQSGSDLLNSSAILNDSGVIKLELMPILASALLEKLNGTPKIPEEKYNKIIQKDIHTLQGKPFIYKCPGGDVVSSDGPGINTTITPATTGISLNQRFA